MNGLLARLFGAERGRQFGRQGLAVFAYRTVQGLCLAQLLFRQLLQFGAVAGAQATVFLVEQQDQRVDPLQQRITRRGLGGALVHLR